MKLGSGNDTVNSADGANDTVDCSTGSDIAFVDKGDKVKNCETVLRKTVIA